MLEGKKYEQATELSIFTLERLRHKTSRLFPDMDHHFWWEFMNHGVESARQIDRQDFKEKLIELAKNAIPPLEGSDVAFSFLQFSLWEYKNGNHNQAIQYVEVASRTDPTWAKPDFILDWLSLIVQNEDALDHFERAMTKDPSVISRIAEDPVCQEHTHILQKLEEKNSN